MFCHWQESAVNVLAEREAELVVYENYITGMLNNFPSLPLARIHNMLQMFMSTGETKCRSRF